MGVAATPLTWDNTQHPKLTCDPPASPSHGTFNPHHSPNPHVGQIDRPKSGTQLGTTGGCLQGGRG